MSKSKLNEVIVRIKSATFDSQLSVYAGEVDGIFDSAFADTVADGIRRKCDRAYIGTYHSMQNREHVIEDIKAKSAKHHAEHNMAAHA